MGVEIECYPLESRALLLSASEYSGHHDASISNLDGVEFKLCHPEKTMLVKGPAFVEKIRPIASIDNKCGLHVHLDRRKDKAKQGSIEAMKFFKATETYWSSLVPSSRKPGANHYVTQIVPTRIATHLGRHGHYEWANITHEDTLEVRIHPATLNPFKMKGWLCAMGAILRHMQTGEPFPAVKEALNVRSQMEAVFEVVTNPIAQHYLNARFNAGGHLRSRTQGEE